MKKMLFVIYLLLGFFPAVVFAANQNLICEPAQGTRVDYFTKNGGNYQNDTFTMGRDRVNTHPHIILEEDKLLFAISDATTVDEAKAEAEKMTILNRSDDQIAFTGMLKDAPFMGSYYPKMKILIYSQQSQWPGPEFVGARAFIFYAKCKEEV